MVIMEGIDFAGVVDSDLKGIQINFALPRRICQFLRGGAALFPQGAAGAGRGGAGRTFLVEICMHPVGNV